MGKSINCDFCGKEESYLGVDNLRDVRFRKIGILCENCDVKFRLMGEILKLKRSESIGSKLKAILALLRTPTWCCSNYDVCRMRLFEIDHHFLCLNCLNFACTHCVDEKYIAEYIESGSRLCGLAFHCASCDEEK